MADPGAVGVTLPHGICRALRQRDRADGVRLGAGLLLDATLDLLLVGERRLLGGLWLFLRGELVPGGGVGTRGYRVGGKVASGRAARAPGARVPALGRVHGRAG